MTDTLDNILVFGFPGCGKSEVQQYVDTLSEKRRAALCVGEFKQLDDYPLVASIFKVDDALEGVDRNRLLSRRQDCDEGGFSDPQCWEMSTKWLAGEYQKLVNLNPDIHNNHTVLLECSRGGAAEEEYPLHHGYLATLGYMPDKLLRKSAILYVQVSPEISRKKNEARYDKNDPFGIMGHMVPRQVMEEDYFQDDVDEMIKNSDRPGFVRSPSGLLIPIGVLDNQTEDLTTWVRDDQMPIEEKEAKAVKLYSGLEGILPGMFERYQMACKERSQMVKL